MPRLMLRRDVSEELLISRRRRRRLRHITPFRHYAIC